ncbi:UDP-glucose iridoid glucosyltransferase-like [Coffea eugenioides]|uniref:UDP-glucose iridoid glucosyltransferase-like n=1 Tax=Coffea eugenioides TaxID=49369 RepID=UPI000F60D66A|nr:UDP-glucose iridoid glucosyltransferase-like [Coffea eugenioides]
MEKLQAERCRRVVLVAYPLQGHLNPLLDLANILHSRGFSITIVHTKFNFPDRANHPDFQFVPISDGISSWDVSPSNLVRLASAINTNCREPFRECLSQMMQQQQEEKQHDQVVCIIYDFLMHFAETVANQMSLPSIIFRTSNAAALLSLCKLPRLKAEGFNCLQDSTSNELVPGLHPLRFKDLPTASMGNLENLLQLVAVVCNIRTSSAIIQNTMDCLEYSSLRQLQEHYSVPLFTLGPLHKMALAKPINLVSKDDNTCIEWLEKKAPNSVIYVSFGSIARMDQNELTEMAWGLANSDQPFLWVIRPGLGGGSDAHLPEGFQELTGNRGCIVKWAPQKDVLAHPAVGGFWSHCGWNSTLESISEGVPMICKPYFVDQTVNARYLTHEWGIGIELDEVMQRTNVAKAIRRILVEEEGSRMRQKVIALKEQIKHCIKEGGSSYNSLNELVQFISSL